MSGPPPSGGVAGATLELRVGNLDCENDAAKLRRGLEGSPGVASVRVKASAGKVEVVLDPERLSRDALVQRLAGIGFPVLADEQEEGIAPPWRNPKVIVSVTSGVLWALAWLLEHAGVPAAVPWTLQLASVLTGGYYFAREAIEELVGEWKIGIELLMTLAAILAFALGHPGEAAMLAFLYSISEAAEGYTEERTRGAVRALMKLAPPVRISSVRKISSRSSTRARSNSIAASRPRT